MPLYELSLNQKYGKPKPFLGYGFQTVYFSVLKLAQKAKTFWLGIGYEKSITDWKTEQWCENRVPEKKQVWYRVDI